MDTTTQDTHPTRNDGLKEVESSTDGIQAFTDRSRIAEGIGVSAVMYRDEKESKILHKYLGIEEHTVFEVESV